MKKVIIALFVILLVLHQDFWAWDDASLVFGFMPIGLFYHAVYALAASGLGILAIKYMWPHSDDGSDSGEGESEKSEIGEADLDLLD